MAKANLSGRRKKVLASAAAAVLAVQGMHQMTSAAVVTFNAAQTISGVSDVSTAGTYLYGYGLGETGAGTTVNGVTFTAWAPGSLSTSAVTTPDGNASITGTSPNQASGAFATAGNGGSGGAIGTINSNGVNQSTSYYNLLTNEEFDVDFGSACTITLTLQHLSPGIQYQFEMWVDDSRASASNAYDRYDAVSGGGGTAVNLLFNTAGYGTNGSAAANSVGEYAIGTFTADTTMQTITIAGGIFPSGPNTISPQLAGFDVETLTPEPASAGLIVLALSTVACRRVRQRPLA
jgi:hypothetical protein